MHSLSENTLIAPCNPSLLNGLSSDFHPSLKLYSIKARNLNTPWIGNEYDPQKKTIFFFHGFPDNPEVWTGLSHQFVEEYNIVMPYLRGVDVSEPSKKIDRYSDESGALDYWQILNYISQEYSTAPDIICIGHDVGGVQALAFAKSLKSLCSKVVLLSSYDLQTMLSKVTSLGQLKKSWYIALMQLPYLPEWFVNKYPNIVMKYANSGNLRLSLVSGFKSTDKFESENYRKKMVNSLDLYRAGFRDSLKRAFIQRKNHQLLIDAPLLVMNASDDKHLCSPKKNDFDKISSDVTIRIFKGGHWFFKDAVENIFLLVKNFISRPNTND